MASLSRAGRQGGRSIALVILLAIAAACSVSPQPSDAQTAPPSGVPPTLSQTDREELERLRQEKQVRELVNQSLQNNSVVNDRLKSEIDRAVQRRLEDSRFLDDRVQAEVDRAFERTTVLLNILLVVLTLIPILSIAGGWLLRRSVISELLSEITASKEEVQQELARQIATSKQEIEQVKLEAKTQLEQMVAEAGNVLAALQREIDIAQQELEGLRDETRSQFQGIFLDVQAEKKRIFQELERFAPSIIQVESVTPEAQQKIQQLTRQLESLESEATLSLTPSDCVKQGDALYFENRYEDAIEAYENAIEINPALATAWIGMGKVLRKQGRYEEALTANQRALDIQPEHPWAWFGRGLALQDLNRYEAALTAYDNVIRFGPVHHHSWRHRGYILTKLGHYDEALQSFERALELQANSSGTRYNLAYYHLTCGDVESAINNLQKAIKLNHKYKAIAQQDKDLQSIWQHAQFKALVER